jgi:hypothetical protein
VAGVDLDGFDRAADKRSHKAGLAGVFTHTGAFEFNHVLKSFRRILRNLASASNPRKWPRLERREAPKEANLLYKFFTLG